ncbi:hypothetical protein SAMN05444416_10183 [Thermoactinomyces sp. DSM 45892]|nr:hypothetical protein SAMN05444416_10183 [Thermoactinomyces sp. DSM 45892]
MNREKKFDLLVTNNKAYQWCYVDTENTFTFMNHTLQISEDVKEYAVYNKAKYTNGALNQYSNKASMEKILIVMNANNQLNFYNENFNPIPFEHIQVKGA